MEWSRRDFLSGMAGVMALSSCAGLQRAEGSRHEYHISKEEGERSLYNMVRAGTMEDEEFLEESWIYSPATGWIDVGAESQIFDENGKYVSPSDYDGSLTRDGKGTRTMILDEPLIRRELRVNPIGETLTVYHAHLYDQITPKDVFAQAKLKSLAERYGRRIVSVMCNRSGLWEYDVSQELQEEMDSFESYKSSGGLVGFEEANPYFINIFLVERLNWADGIHGEGRSERLSQLERTIRFIRVMDMMGVHVVHRPVH